MKKIEVVAAVIFSPCGTELFISRRSEKAHQGGLWEFPGGKKESNETPEQGLYRELKEELGIVVTACKPLIKLTHDYVDKLIELDVYRIDSFDGKAYGAEGQEAQWVKLTDLNKFNFPEANKAIIKKLLES
jgi:8-oxo-dGTP diphosphatase